MDKNFKAVNAPILDFEPGSKHREALLIEIERQSNRQKEVPVIIHGKAIKSAFDAGQKIFGENYLQEALEKKKLKWQ